MEGLIRFGVLALWVFSRHSLAGTVGAPSGCSLSRFHGSDGVAHSPELTWFYSGRVP